MSTHRSHRKDLNQPSLLLLGLCFLLVADCSGRASGSSLVPDSAPVAVVEAVSSPSAVEEAPRVVGRVMPAVWDTAPSLKPRAVAPPEVSAAAAVVLDEASNTVLFDKSAHLPLPPASLTKIATLILALEHGDLDSMVDSDVDSRTMRGSSVMGLLPDDHFPLRDLLYGLVLPSGNDAALAIARKVSGSDQAFVDQMNLLLQRLDLHDSHFLNPHGLGGGVGPGSHVASAYDLAELARYGMSLPGFEAVSTASSYVMHGSRDLPLSNLNTFLSSYPGADGVKTGYTRSAGQTLVASATREGHRVYAVVLNAPNRNGDASRLLNWAFTSYDWPQ